MTRQPFLWTALLTLTAVTAFGQIKSKNNSVYYDSLNYDTCKITKVNFRKEYCICWNRLNKISRFGTFSGKHEYWKIYTQGELLCEGRKKNGKKIGIWKEYYLSGHELMIGKFKNGVRFGIWTVYYNELFDLRIDDKMKIKSGNLQFDKTGKQISRKIFKNVGLFSIN